MEVPSRAFARTASAEPFARVRMITSSSAGGLGECDALGMRGVKPGLAIVVGQYVDHLHLLQVRRHFCGATAPAKTTGVLSIRDQHYEA